MTDDQARRIQQQFGASARAYVTSTTHAGGEDLERLLGWGRMREVDRLLDVATGGGHTALAFTAVARRVVAFDLTPPMLQAARAFTRERGARTIAFVAGDVEAQPFRDGAFDAVTCRIAAHHFADVAAAVREIARVLAPGGSFLLEDIAGHDDPDAAAFILEVERRRDSSHVRSYRPSEWRALLEAAGLGVAETGVTRKVRGWEDWTGRMRMTPAARQDLDRFVRAAPAACRKAFDFRLTDRGIESFADDMVLIRASKPGRAAR